MTIVASQLPAKSALTALRCKGDFLDCYFARVDPGDMSAGEAALTIFSDAPRWVSRLLALRNVLVTPFGLKTGPFGDADQQVPQALAPGDSIGVFRVFAVSDKEIILGENDKHLDFRVSVFKSEDGFHTATWVLPHNFLGRCYLALIMPFHKVIVKTCAARLAA